jgi:hypothetical protein
MKGDPNVHTIGEAYPVVVAAPATPPRPPDRTPERQPPNPLVALLVVALLWLLAWAAQPLSDDQAQACEDDPACEMVLR